MKMYALDGLAIRNQVNRCAALLNLEVKFRKTPSGRIFGFCRCFSFPLETLTGYRHVLLPPASGIPVDGYHDIGTVDYGLAQSHAAKQK